MNPRASTLGALLAGGHSRRMGTDKAGLAMGGRSLLAQTLEAMQNLDDVIVVGRPRAVSDIDPAQVDWIEDLTPDGGPVAGLLAAMQRAETRGHGWTVFAPCDLPGLRSGDISELVQHARASSCDVVVADGETQPNWILGAVATGALESLLASFEQGERSLRGVFARQSVHLWQPSRGVDRLADVDTPEELNAWRASNTTRGGGAG